MVLVPETPVVAPQPRLRLPAFPPEKSKRTKEEGHDYGYLHAFGASERRGRLSEEKGRSGASASGSEPASTAEGPASAATEAEEREESPQRLVIAETPTVAGSGTPGARRSVDALAVALASEKVGRNAIKSVPK